CADLRHLPSFPPRRSSDLCLGPWAPRRARCWCPPPAESTAPAPRGPRGHRDRFLPPAPPRRRTPAGARPEPQTAFASPPTTLSRSEEHTSELQSRENLVCR